nr:ChaN family lipoprotein [uncultured Flavobacterium sp.]
MKNAIILLFIFWTNVMFSQNFTPFKIYKTDGKSISDKKLLKDLAQADIILFGELHDNSIAHWLQLKFVKELHQVRKISVGMEMFETDNQSILDDYLKSKITQKQLDTLARLWNNYKTDYKPIVDFCKENSLSVIATNVPRRYANILYKQGEEALMKLPEADKKWFPTLPMPYNPELPAYKTMLKMFGDANHANLNFPKAQAFKDYTMANAIAGNLNDSKLHIHFNGSYHSDNYEGIYWYLKQINPNFKIVTISTVLQEKLDKLEIKNKKISDYIIVTDIDITRTY